MNFHVIFKVHITEFNIIEFRMKVWHSPQHIEDYVIHHANRLTAGYDYPVTYTIRKARK